MDTNERLKYSEQWKSSAEHFLSNNDYDWMSVGISKYSLILEIGCGTGHSTLKMLENGHKVIAVDKNEYCIEEAKSLLNEYGYKYCDIDNYDELSDVIFLNADICDDLFYEYIESFDFDVVTCWNIGTHWSRYMMEFYLGKMIEYGLTIDQIKENTESSYGELIQWKTVELAARKGVTVHLVDRNFEALNENNDVYFNMLGNQFNLKNIIYNSRDTNTKSLGGIQLTDGINEIKKNLIDIVLVSVILF